MPFRELLHHEVTAVSSSSSGQRGGVVERLAAVVVLVLGGLALLATGYAVAVEAWESSLAKVLILLLVIVGMWRAASHLRRPSSAS